MTNCSLQSTIILAQSLPDTYADDLHNVIALINHKLQCIILPFPRPFPLINYLLKDHVQSSAGNSSFELCQCREPRKYYPSWCCTVLYSFKETERLSQQCRVVCNLVAANCSHGQLEDDLVNTVKGVRNSVGRRRDTVQP